MTLPPELLGPLGLTIALGIAVTVLGRLHLESDRRERANTDFWRDLALSGTHLAQSGTELAVKALDVRKRPGNG